jgi:hypothetical protein
MPDFIEPFALVFGLTNRKYPTLAFQRINIQEKRLRIGGDTVTLSWRVGDDY